MKKMKLPKMEVYGVNPETDIYDDEEIVIYGSEIKTVKKNESQTEPVIRMPKEPVAAGFWYEKYPTLLGEERKAFAEFGQAFMAGSKDPNPFRVKFFFDQQKHFCAKVTFRLLIAKRTLIEIANALKEKYPTQAEKTLNALKVFPEPGMRNYEFTLVYDHSFPGRGSANTTGGPIRAYITEGLSSRAGFSHCLMDRNVGEYFGLPYVCQVSTVGTEQVNAKRALERITARWLLVMMFWEATGVDLEHQCIGWYELWKEWKIKHERNKLIY